MLFNLEIPPVMSVMSALVLAVMLGLSTAWVKSEEMERLLEVFQNMVLKLVERVLMRSCRFSSPQISVSLVMRGRLQSSCLSFYPSC